MVFGGMGESGEGEKVSRAWGDHTNKSSHQDFGLDEGGSG